MCQLPEFNLDKVCAAEVECGECRYLTQPLLSRLKSLANNKRHISVNFFKLQMSKNMIRGGVGVLIET